MSFLRSVDNEVRKFATDSDLKKHPSKFLSVCQNAVLNNERLEMDFRLIVVSIVEVIKTLFMVFSGHWCQNWQILELTNF